VAGKRRLARCGSEPPEPSANPPHHRNREIQIRSLRTQAEVGSERGARETFFRRPEVPGFWPSKGVVAFCVTVKSPMVGPPTFRRRSPREARGVVARSGRWWWRDRE